MNYQLSRRSFIHATTFIALTQAISGCSNSKADFKIFFLENSIPPQLIKDFHQAINNQAKINFQPQAQLEQIFDSLLNLHQGKESDADKRKLFDQILSKPVIYPSLTTLGDFWLSSAIKQNLIQPLTTKDLASWQKLPAIWQKIVQRNDQGNLAADGQIWGAPYRWGSTVIAYQSKKLDKMGVTIKNWSDLWQPELGDRLSLLDSPRETIGLTLKKLGHSYNTENIDSIPELETELLALHKQTKLYSSDHYLEPLILGDTWVAVAWSTDILPLLKRYPDIKLVIPASGASLWTDIWIKPQVSKLINNNNSFKTIAEWIDFCWQPKAAEQISLFTDGISPILSTIKPEELPSDLRDNLLSNSQVLNSPKSEFLLPLSAKTEQQYRDLWLKIRQSAEKE
ncbi:extracellular solute-binding protein [Pleurocapsa sp. FMAR1]|uniref:extracellular solute-binding protein n=1 Tax=Pleurocapsa sp. FMAR1 TaxID=3040204 RepID=UPI0029C7AC65|nr:extracellular solute-binding protein [Pleurocapsa sp. FMAR1]